MSRSKRPVAKMAEHEPEVLLNLIVNHIPTSIDEFELRDIFEQYGSVQSVKIITDRRNDEGHAYVKYCAAESAIEAIRCINGCTTQLKVDYAKKKEAQKPLKEFQARQKKLMRTQNLRADAQRKNFWPSTYYRGDYAIPICSTIETFESISLDIYPKDVAALTLALLCGPLEAEAAVSEL